MSYALNPDHPRGRHKRACFVRRSASDRGDWRYLHDQLVAAVVGAPVRATRITPFGVLYDVVVLIDGLTGSTYPVATVWLVEGDGAPRLVSTGVDIP